MGIFKRKPKEIEHVIAETLCELVNKGDIIISWSRVKNDFIFALTDQGKEKANENERLREMGVVIATEDGLNQINKIAGQ